MDTPQTLQELTNPKLLIFHSEEDRSKFVKSLIDPAQARQERPSLIQQLEPVGMMGLPPYLPPMVVAEGLVEKGKVGLIYDDEHARRIMAKVRKEKESQATP